MATISRIRPHLPESLLAAAAPAPIAPAALLLVAMAAGGLGLTVLGRPPTAPEAPPPATVTETEAADLPRGDLPIIGDPIRDLTIWWSNRLTDANRAGLDSLRGRALTPIDETFAGGTCWAGSSTSTTALLRDQIWVFDPQYAVRPCLAGRYKRAHLSAARICCLPAVDGR